MQRPVRPRLEADRSEGSAGTFGTMKGTAGDRERSVPTLRRARDLAAGLGMHRVVGDVKDRNAIIVDDMIDTAGTMTTAATVFQGVGAGAWGTVRSADSGPCWLRPEVAATR